MYDFKSLVKLFQSHVFSGKEAKEREERAYNLELEKIKLEQIKFSGRDGLQVFKEDTERSEAFCFPPEGLGKVVLSRDGVVRHAMDLIDAQLSRKWGNTSLYLYGARGSGKSIILQLLAKKLKDKGFIVYFYGPGETMQATRGGSFMKDLPSGTSAKVAVIIDEVPAGSQEMISLLKSTRTSLVVIGAGVPQFVKSGYTHYFKERMSGELKLRVRGSDMNELIQKWKEVLPAAEHAAMEEICDFLCDYCGGHFYPTARFMEYAFTDPTAESFRKSFEAFRGHFFSKEFHDSRAYKDVMVRCFNEDFDLPTAEMLSRVLAGKSSGTDVETMMRLGWWSPEKQDVMSTLLSNVFLSSVKPDQSTADDQIQLEHTNDPQENLEAIIVAGLWRMEPNDFFCIRSDPGKSNVKTEDGISFSWGRHVMASVKNVFLQFQARAYSGRVDFYANGFIGGVVENMLNGVRAATGSQSIPLHLEKMKKDKYHWDVWAVLNFAITPKKQPTKTTKTDNIKEVIVQPTYAEVVLPSSFGKDDAVLSRIYTFVHEDNALYQGRDLIKMPAVKSLPSVSCHIYVPLRDRKKGGTGAGAGGAKQFSTVAGPASSWPRVVHGVRLCRRLLLR